MRPRSTIFSRQNCGYRPGSINVLNARPITVPHILLFQQYQAVRWEYPVRCSYRVGDQDSISSRGRTFRLPCLIQTDPRTFSDFYSIETGSIKSWVNIVKMAIHLRLPKKVKNEFRFTFTRTFICVVWRLTTQSFFLNKQLDALIIQIYSVIKLYMFRAPLPIISFLLYI